MNCWRAGSQSLLSCWREDRHTQQFYSFMNSAEREKESERGKSSPGQNSSRSLTYLLIGACRCFLRTLTNSAMGAGGSVCVCVRMWETERQRECSQDVTGWTVLNLCQHGVSLSSGPLCGWDWAVSVCLCTCLWGWGGGVRGQCLWLFLENIKN